MWGFFALLFTTEELGDFPHRNSGFSLSENLLNCLVEKVMKHVEKVNKKKL